MDGSTLKIDNMMGIWVAIARGYLEPSLNIESKSSHSSGGWAPIKRVQWRHRRFWKRSLIPKPAFCRCQEAIRSPRTQSVNLPQTPLSMSHLCVRWMMINAMVRCYWNPCSVAWVQPPAEPLAPLRSMRIHTWEAKYLKVPKLASQNVQKSKKAPHTTICLWEAAAIDCYWWLFPLLLFVVFFLCLHLFICRTQQNHRHRHHISLAEPNKLTWVLARCSRRAVSEKVLWWWDLQLQAFLPSLPGHPKKTWLHQGHCSAVTDGFLKVNFAV